MYNDYPTIYQSKINENLIYWIILGILLLGIILICLVSLSKIFKKANRSAISAWIPFYNIWILLEIVDVPTWYFLLLLIPGLNIYILFKIMTILAKYFQRGSNFAFGLLLLPFIFYPILAFSKNEYIGINMKAMEGKNAVVDIPKVEEEINPVVHEEVDQSSNHLNISIGGGVYQKDYTNTLLQVDEVQAVTNTNTNQENQPKNPYAFSTPVFINPIEEEKKEIEEPKEMTISFPEPSIKVEEIKPIMQEPKISNIESPSIVMPNLKTQEPESISNPLPEKVSDSEFVVCPKCGTKVKKNAKVCFLCGNTLNF